MADEGFTAEAGAAFLDALEAHVARGDTLGAPVTVRERALLVYAGKLTRTPAEMHPDDVEALRQAGLDDGEILDANQVTAYFAYANRVADGLGLTVEPWHR